MYKSAVEPKKVGCAYCLYLDKSTPHITKQTR